MARDDRSTRSNRSEDDTQDVSARPHSRDPYRDNDDVRDPLPADQRAGTKPDTRNEARGDARENVGNTARDTARDTAAET